MDEDAERQLAGGYPTRELMRMINRRRARETKRPWRTDPSNVAVELSTETGTESRATAGPEAPGVVRSALASAIGRDEAEALVEAAKQYRQTKAGSQARLDDLRKLASELDLDVSFVRMAEAKVGQRDARLETVALVLPYIERLERRLDGLRGHKSVAELEAQVERQRKQIERLVSERVLADQARAGRN